MKKYTKVYMEFFGYTVADFMPCEIPGCKAKAVDVCHIWAKSIRRDLENKIDNLMGKCREHHAEYGDVKGETREWLQEVHNDFMKKNGVGPVEDKTERAKPKKRKQLYQTWKK